MCVRQCVCVLPHLLALCTDLNLIKTPLNFLECHSAALPEAIVGTHFEGWLYFLQPPGNYFYVFLHLQASGFLFLLLSFISKLMIVFHFKMLQMYFPSTVLILELRTLLFYAVWTKYAPQSWSSVLTDVEPLMSWASATYLSFSVWRGLCEKNHTHTGVGGAINAGWKWHVCLWHRTSSHKQNKTKTTSRSARFLLGLLILGLLWKHVLLGTRDFLLFGFKFLTWLDIKLCK